MRFRFLGLLLIFFVYGGGMSLQAQTKSEIRAAKRDFDDFLYYKAQPVFKQAVEQQPNDPKLNAMLGACMVELHNDFHALKYLEVAWEGDPKAVDKLELYYARALHANYRFDDALTHYRNVSKQYAVNEPDFLALSMAMSQCKFAKEIILNPIDVQIDNLGPAINTENPEYAPVINADETLLMFISRRAENYGGRRVETDGSYYEDIYISQKEGDQWQPAYNAGAVVNTEFQDAPVALAPDGQTLFIHRDDNGGDLFISHLDGEKWTAPENMGSHVNSTYWEPSICVSADGRKIFFTSNRPGGAGKLDIYTTELNDEGIWSPPRNIGNTINTLLDEDNPYFHPDGKTLYFSSKGHKTMGGYDIFKSVLKSDGNWTKPINIGYPINTPGNDMFFTMSASGRHGYYSSAVGPDNYGEQDIYRITFPPAGDTLTYSPTSSVTILKGVITNAETHRPLEASVIIVDNGTGDTLSILKSNRSTGKYLITLPPGKNYGIVASTSGFLFCSENVDIPVTQKEYQEIIQNLELQPIRRGSKVVLNNIFFDFDKASLRSESFPELGRLVVVMQQNPNMRLRIAGHTDSKGSDDYNQKLSESRAQSVVDYLIVQGVAAGRLEAKGYGETQPIATNDTAEGRQRNRRTEFEVLTE